MIQPKHQIALLLTLATLFTFAPALAPAPALAQAACNGGVIWTGAAPDCLAAGANYRIMFLSRTGGTARNADITAFNSFLQGQANAATGNPFSGITFNVLGSTATVDARDNTDTNPTTDGTGEPIFYYQGRRVADNYADLYDGSWDTTEPRDQNGAIFGGVHSDGRVWTGSLDNGIESNIGTNGASRALSSTSFVATGRPRTAGEQLAAFSAPTGSGTRSFYALSEVIRKPVAGGVNICGRTPQVRDAILAASVDTFCMSVSDLATITTLGLDNAGITALASGDFAGLTGLTHLLLLNNALTTLPANIFTGLTALRQLNLFNNNLDTLPLTVFAGLTTVDELYINRNNFESLPVGIFNGLTALANLALANNPFTEDNGLPAGIFDDVLDTLVTTATSGGVGLTVDDVGRAAHFVCSRTDANAIVAVTSGVSSCLRISTAQLTAAIPLIDDATLSGLAIFEDVGILTPTFDPDTTAYAVAVDDSVSTVQFVPTAAQSGATISVNAIPIDSGTNSDPIPLTEGMPRDIPIVVTAADGTTTMTYTVTATLAAAIPTVSNVAFTSTGPYALGEAIEVTVTFSENVIVVNTPAIALDINGNSRQAAYTSGTGSANLVFTYTVTANETDANGVGINANAISTPGGSTIQNATGDDAVLTHDAVPQNLTHRVDTAAPTLTTDGATVNGNSMVLTYSEALDDSSTPANAAYTIGVSGTGTAPTVSEITIDNTRVTLSLSAAITRGLTVTVSYAPGTTPLQDTAGNDAAALTARSVTNATPAPANMIYTDDVIPATLDVGQEFSVDFEINHADASEVSNILWSSVTDSCNIRPAVSGAGLFTFTPLVAHAGMTCNFSVRFVDTADSEIDVFEFSVDINAAAAVRPAVSGVAFTSTGPYALGEAIEVTVTFSQNATVTGAPAIALTVGANTRMAAFTSGSGSATLLFAYTVVAGETDADGVSIGANAITTPGSSSIQNAVGTATLTHDAVAANTAHAVDTTAPALTVATVNGDSMVLTYSEALNPSSSPANAAYTIGVSGAGTAPTVSEITIGNTRVTLSLSAAITRGLTVTVSYAPGSTPLQDIAGNNAAGLTTSTVTNATPAPEDMIYSDDDIPTTLNVGQEFRVDFDINVFNNGGFGAFWRGTTNSCGIGRRVGNDDGLYTFTPGMAHAGRTCNFGIEFIDDSDTSVDTFTFTVLITAPTATLAGTLTEANLFAATAPTVTVRLENTEYERTGTLQQRHFTVTDTVAGTVSVSGITRDSGTVVDLTLAYTGEDITTPGTLSVTLAAAGHTATGDLITDTIPITASVGMNICDRTEQVRNAIIAGSAATECTNVSAAHLASVTTLTLGAMMIDTLQSGDFAGLTGLATLRLADNRLSTLPADLFNGLSALTFLTLDENQFSTLDANVFAGLSALVTLSLGENNLTTLNANLFNGLTALQSLRLSSNGLRTLPTDLFNGLTVLRGLNLDDNAFTAGTGLPTGIFDDVLNTLGDIREGIENSIQFIVDDTVREAHFVCSRSDFAAIVAATDGVEDCLRISSAQLNTAIPLIDATLSGLTLSSGNLTPGFDAATTTYTVSLPNSVGNLTVTPTATNANAGATITVRGNPVASGVASAFLALTPSTPLTIPIVVTAAASATRMTYTVTATRAEDMATVSGVAFTSTGPYALGEAIQVTVTFSENVTVVGTPAIGLTVGTTARTATYTSGSGSANLVFAYTVAAGETDANGVSIGANALTTPGSTIRNAGGNDAVLTHDAVAEATAHAVDTAAPTLTGATVNGNSMVLTYNENLDASSTPANAAYSIAVDSGMVPRVTGTTISNTMVTLTLNIAVTRGVTVAVIYTPGSAPLQDTAGNDAAALDTEFVTNATPEPANTIYTDDVIPATLNVGEAFRVDFDINHPDAESSSFGNLWARTSNDCGIPLSINDAGLLAFTPQAAQAEMTCNFVVRFEDPVVNAIVDTLEFAVRINAADPVAPVASDGSRTVTEGDSIAINLGVTGTSPVTCATSSPLPGGLTLTAACTITGDIAEDAITNGTLSQVFVIAYTATNSTGSDTGAYTLTVNALNSAPTFGGAGIVAQIYAVGVSIVPVNLPTGTGGDGALTHTLAPALPNGLTLTGAILSGTPAAEQDATTYTYTVSDSDADTSPADTDSVTFTITIVPAVGVTVTPTTLTIPEAGGTAPYTVVLNSAPTADVMIAVAGAPDTAATISTASLTFTTSNWNVAQTVTVTGVNDNVDNPNNRTATVTHRAPSNGDDRYDGITIASVAVAVIDDDDPPMVDRAVINELNNQIFPIDVSIVSMTLPGATSRGTLTYELSGLPDGLTFNTDTRIISGTPTSAGNFPLIYTIRDAVGFTTIPFTLTISSPTEERTTQLNQQILPRVFLSVVDGGNQLIAERLRNGNAAMSGGGGGGSMSLTGDGGVLSPGVLKQAGQWLSGDTDELPWRDWVGGLALSTDGSRLGLAPGVSLYANGNYTRLSGDESELDWDGMLYGGHVGADSWVNDDMLVGVSASYFKGEFDYTGVGVNDGEYNVQVGSFQPYFGWTLLEGVDFWASGSYGAGDVELNDSGERRESDLWYGSISAGVSGQVYASDALIAGGLSELRVRGDGTALWVEMDEDEDGFEDLKNRRVRIGLEASHTRSAMRYGSLRTGLEVGVRSDSGDGPSGKGLEVGGSVEWSDAMPGLTLSGRGRLLTLGIYDEWGVSGALRLTPGNDGHGLSFSLSPGYGQENSGIEQLWQTGALGGVTSGVTSSAAPSARMRMDSEVGYGLPSSFGMVHPYLAASLQQGGGQTQRMGARWELSPGMKLNLEGTRRERATANDEHRIQLQWQWRW